MNENVLKKNSSHRLNITKADNVVDLKEIYDSILVQKVMPTKTPLSIGEAIPPFELFDQDGQTFSSEDHKSKPLVIFFYLKTTHQDVRLKRVAFAIMKVNLPLWE